MERYDTLLISSGSAQLRANLREALDGGFNLLEAVSIRQMLLLLKQNCNCIAALVLDMAQTEALDEAAIQGEDNTALLEQVPVIVISRSDTPDELNRAFAFGAADVIPADYEPYAMRHRIDNIVELHLHKRSLESMLEEQANVLRYANDSVVDALSSIIEYRSVESGQHILRIRHFTKILLKEVASCCPEYNLTENVIDIISSAAALHDIGKIAIPDSILLKPGKLTEEEQAVMKTHAMTGSNILNSLTNVADREYLHYAHNVCRYHHERWDGRGYPEGLSGEDIPICAQVVGLADVYDALTTKRVYKDAVSPSQAVNMILQGECGVFSPKLLECFKHVTHLFEELARDYADGLSPKTEVFEIAPPTNQVTEDENSIERTRGKYFALVHYVNGFLMEVNMDAGLFHVIYNPYPELAQIQGISTFAQLQKVILEQLVHPKDKAHMKQLIERGITEFLDEGLRRQSNRFYVQSGTNPEGELFEITFLRINPVDTQRRTLAVLVRKVAEQVLQKEVRRVHSLADAVYTCRNDREFTMIEAGTDGYALVGYTADEIRQKLGGGLVELVHPDDRERVRKEFYEQLESGADIRQEFRVLRKDGSSRWVLCNGRMEMDADGEEILYSTLTDITRFRRNNEELLRKLDRYEIILAQTENVLFEWDMISERIEFSDTWRKIFGYAPTQEELRPQLTEGTHLHPDDLPLLFDGIGRMENGSDYESVEVRIATDKGRYLWCRFRATAIRDENGKLLKISGIIINIDAEKQAERAMQDRAERDPLTKLLNKDAGHRQAEEYLARFSDGASAAMFIIDLDNFKQVNDQYGHLFGDAVLTQAAREIKKIFRNQDIVSRIGGDEFLVLMRGVSDRKLVESRSQHLLSIFQTVFQNQKYKLNLGCSIGVAISPDHGRNYYDLFNRADQALYWAKGKGKNNFVIFDEANERLLYQNGKGSAVNSRIDSNEEPGLAEDNLVRYAFQRLYTSKDMKKSVNDILGMVGRKINVSRVYIFENSDDNRFCSNTFEWCNEGISPEIDSLQNISYETDIPGYEHNFNERGIFYCSDINELPKVTYDIVASQGIKSMLHCAIRDSGVFRGYIGFDECVEQRFWTKEEIQTLAYFSEMLSLFLLKQRKQEKSQLYAQGLQSILDNQNAWIYIIDPDTCELKYLNAKTRELAPDVTPGMRCYKALMDREERCPGCPSLGIRNCINDSTVLYNDKFELNVLADATLIQWEGADACLLTCRKLPKGEAPAGTEG